MSAPPQEAHLVFANTHLDKRKGKQLYLACMPVTHAPYVHIYTIRRMNHKLVYMMRTVKGRILELLFHSTGDCHFSTRYVRGKSGAYAPDVKTPLEQVSGLRQPFSTLHQQRHFLTDQAHVWMIGPLHDHPANEPVSARGCGGGGGGRGGGGGEGLGGGGGGKRGGLTMRLRHTST